MLHINHSIVVSKNLELDARVKFEELDEHPMTTRQKYQSTTMGSEILQTRTSNIAKKLDSFRG